MSVSRLLFQVTVPLSMLLIPFAARYAARGLGLRRPNLVGAFTAAAVLLMTATNTYALFAEASLGKTVGRVIFIPLVIGATADLLRRKDAATSVKATLASFSAVGCSPSLAIAAGIVVASFTAAALWELIARRADDIRPQWATFVWVSLPLACLTVFAIVAQLIHKTRGLVPVDRPGALPVGHTGEGVERRVVPGGRPRPPLPS